MLVYRTLGCLAGSSRSGEWTGKPIQKDSPFDLICLDLGRTCTVSCDQIEAMVVRPALSRLGPHFVLWQLQRWKSVLNAEHTPPKGYYCKKRISGHPKGREHLVQIYSKLRGEHALEVSGDAVTTLSILPIDIPVLKIEHGTPLFSSHHAATQRQSTSTYIWAWQSLHIHPFGGSGYSVTSPYDGLLLILLFVRESSR